MKKPANMLLKNLRYLCLMGVIALGLITIVGSNGGEDGGNGSTTDITPPSVPASLTATAASSNQIDLSWTASTDDVGVTGYKVYRDGSYLKSVTSTSTSDTELSSSTQYCYNVTAYDTAGNESDQSAQVCATTLTETTVSSEFPIATTTAMEIAISAAFDGTNYLVGIQGDETHHANITAQLVSQTGALVGSRISVGRTGGMPEGVAFDGNNYLMVWEDDANHPNDDIYGQLISTSGILVGSPFPICTAAGEQDSGFIGYDGANNYLVIWTDGRSSTDDQGPWYVYGQIVSKDGSLVGGEIQISTEPGHFQSIAFDGTNFLVVWVEDTNDTDIYGQFISPSGAPVGQNFVIDSNSLPSDNYSSLLFDGTRYIVNFLDEVSANTWESYIRSVAKDGIVSETRVTLPSGVVAAFDGTNYLVLQFEDWGTSSTTVKGMFYDTNINPVGPEFTLATTVDDRIPWIVGILFGGSKYFVVVSRATPGTDPQDISAYTNADVYGAFIIQ